MKTRAVRMIPLFLLVLAALFLPAGWHCPATIVCAETVPDLNGLAETDLQVNPYGGSKEDPETISLFMSEGKYWLFLPSDATDGITCYLTGNALLDGQQLINGEKCVAFLQEGEHILSIESGDGAEQETRTAALEVVRSANIPAVYIATSSQPLAYIHESKENYDSGILRVRECGKITLDAVFQQLKGRGNATWNYAKKPYNIKFKDKTDLLEMGEAKKWSLLASYVDPTLLRNPLGWYLSDASGLSYTSAYRHIDLYINGEYQGNYIACESVEVGTNRVDVNDLEKENKNLNSDAGEFGNIGSGPDGTILPGSEKNSYKWVDMPVSPDDVSGGYLLELDYEERYDKEISGFVAGTGQCFVIKSPEHATKEETEYIRAIVNDAEEALYSGSGYNEKGKHYSEYFDIDSLVSMYIIRELGNDIDAGFSSTYLTKPENSEKLLVSPIWDMDRAFGDHLVRFGVDYGDPNIWWTNSLYYYIGTNRIPTIFNAAYRHQDFRSEVRQKWSRLAEDGVLDSAVEFICEQRETLRASARMDAIRWNIYGTNNPEEVSNRYTDVCDAMISFLNSRRQSLDRGFSDEAVMVYYDPNGGTGGVFDPAILRKGDVATVQDCVQGENYVLPPREGFLFSSWNTEPDGTGTSLMPGDQFEISGDTVLYAIWKDPSQPEEKSETIDIDNLVMRENRSEYESDEAFGNFRAIIPGRLYRSANPLFLNEKGAAIRELMDEAGIQTVLNLSYDPEELFGAFLDESLGMCCYKKDYDAGNVFTVKMAFDFYSEEFGRQMAEGLSFLAEHDPPYLFHCMGGWDRTGFFATILEMLMGWDKEEIIRDYMLTYTNYHGIQEGTDAYNQLADRRIISILDRLEEIYPSTDLKGTAKAYLITNGMNEETLAALISKLQPAEN